MTRQEIAVHSLQAEFMDEADPDEWYDLPGGTHKGQRIPDYEGEAMSVTGCWIAVPLEDPDA